jgi:putative transposase
MHLVENSLYHIYNRGNNKQQVFLNSRHYDYFLSLIRKNVYPACDVLALCLMPNHFHLLIHANQDSVLLIKDGSFARQQFSQGVKQLLSTYTKSFNKVMDQTASMFQQKTKSKDVTNIKYAYALTAFHYIHHV